ncbi:precorrin-2 dehydrogenase/sirohydrochlorin ferrochelatase family protein [Paenibacillus endoradicis]|uniref:precorrin-2 dehydrogenase/sirohydrochlorin ferrochelatase family protein n=1 Tax=Paenibacillus endoradicis TaxID=2972487 RepID=UPI002159547D|nr:bifunctional precorrin-2 dehydrogenase/sirohydrochlorin ferrochelatase [Paenibacillus endoradicis]MCR8655689.1 bifunctional precorrin-2 dehydrogenase/sirohydrochlorin ferrochelatase [Paenibacillus endoradicis]MCR8658015.1 bifunctional precorrin-2 dehydrogenase/sirohydrochlorin ferrochelatase [Paenibacillus endoradicis]
MEQNSLYYPMMVNLLFHKCLIVGGGVIATRKVAGLLAGNATSITIVAPDISRSLQELIKLNKSLTWIQSTYEETLMQHFTIVFAATDRVELNDTITEDALNKGILVCNVSNGEQGNFITPATIREGQLTLAISTSGSSPSLTKHLKRQLEEQFTKPYADALQLMSRLRSDLGRDGIELTISARITEQALQEVFQVSSADYEMWYKNLRQRYTT